jgi:formylglycine-generating enzyme required for sulfatase activity
MPPIQQSEPAAKCNRAGAPYAEYRFASRAEIAPQPDRRSGKRGTESSSITENTFRDHDWAPLMSVVPSGRFLMGSSEDEPARGVNEGPQHEVVFERPFAIGVFPVTCREFAPFAQTIRDWIPGALEWNGYGFEHLDDARWDNPGFSQGDLHPVTCVSFEDALSYVEWLATATGKRYRLPSEAEWEYVARAGTAAPYWWGTDISNSFAHYDRSSLSLQFGVADQRRSGTISVAPRSANPWGICDILGNVWEWCEDTWHPNYEGAPSDGSAWIGDRSDRRIVRGGSWSGDADVLRCAQRRWVNGHNRMTNVGLRVALSL